MKVLVITIAGLRPDFLGCYGCDWIETPALDKLAAEGVVFDRHYADNPTLAGACHAWRTGCHWLPGPETPDRPPARDDLLALLGNAGAASLLITPEGPSLPPWFLEGWSKVRQVDSGAEDPGVEAVVKATAKAFPRLDAAEHSLLWLSWPSLLPPWHIPENFLAAYFEHEDEAEEGPDEDEGHEEDCLPLLPLLSPSPGFLPDSERVTIKRLQQTFAAAVSHCDAGLDLLLETLGQFPSFEEWHVLVTSNSGQFLGEHGLVGPWRPWLHDEQQHLPLLVRLPGKHQAGRRVPHLTQPVDLPATLLDFLGKSTNALHGQSLRPLCQGTTGAARPYACAGWQVDHHLDWSIRTPEWKLITPVSGEQPSDSPRGPQLYVKPEDRWEVNNVIQHHPDLAQELEEKLRAYMSLKHP